MTLILTALCKNGICVCADKRSVTWDSNGLKRHDDNLNKIYEFADIPLIILNHGINKFNNKLWDDFCSEYEDLDRWKDKDLIQIADDFKNFVENDIQGELRRNEQNEQLLNSTDFSNKVGFILCGKTPKDSKFKIKEFFWSLDSNKELCCQPKRHKGGLVRTGSGRRYLEDYFAKSGNGKFDSIPYWKKMKIAQAEKELGKLFSIAVKERKRLKGDEFSDNFDIKCI